MLIVQDGSAHTPREHSRQPQRRLAARTSRTRATAHPISSCLLAIGPLSGPSTRWFVDDHCESQGGLGDIIFDPLFLALPELEKARKKTAEHQGRLCSKEQIFAGESCDIAMCLSQLAAMNLEVICDVQEVASTITASAMTK
jgi:hypothetical protein